MKKILQIARYDFKRIAFNPITLIGFAVVMVLCLILGFAYKIPNTAEYKASLSGQTTKEVYQSFTSADNKYDTKTKLDGILADARLLIDVHNTTCLEVDEFNSIRQDFDTILEELERFKIFGDCAYTPSNLTPISNAVSNLESFIGNFKTMEKFHSRLVFSKAQMEDLENVVIFFKKSLNSSTDVRTILNTIYNGRSNFTKLRTVSAKAFTFNVDSVHLAEFKSEYIDAAQEKLANIFAEMSYLNNTASPRDTSDAKKMKQLATNYKLTCESAKKAIEAEYTLLMDSLSIKINKMYGYGKFSLEETKLELLLSKHFLKDESLYYTQHQQALNFNTASYQTTAFDHSYFMMSIVGFLTVIFGIITAYKLFGRDKRNGKMDLILSQDVSFNQVFVGKFLAVLWSTSFAVLLFGVVTMAWGSIFYGFLPGKMLAVFNLQKAYTISPFGFLLIKLIGIELQAMFYSIFAIFMMNLSRKFELTFGITLLIFAIATVCNIFLNGQLWYCLLPFVHADLTSFIGGATMNTGFLKTSLFSYGNFFISLVYHFVLTTLLFIFTKQLFKKN